MGAREYTNSANLVPVSMKTRVGCEEMALESSGKNMLPETHQTQTHSLAEGAGKSGDSERQGGSGVALGLRKESRPDVFSNRGSTERPWAREKGQMASFTKRILKVVTWCSLEDKGAFRALLRSWTPFFPPLSFFCFFFF